MLFSFMSEITDNSSKLSCVLYLFMYLFTYLFSSFQDIGQRTSTLRTEELQKSFVHAEKSFIASFKKPANVAMETWEAWD